MTPTISEEEALDLIEIDFWRFHLAHPEVYEELRKLALKLRDQGIKSYSIKALYEVVRFRQVFISRDASDWMLNNNYTALYARLLMQKEPSLTDFFRTRIRRTPKQPILKPNAA